MYGHYPPPYAPQVMPTYAPPPMVPPKLPWLGWLIAAALGLLAGYGSIKLPPFPTLPTLPPVKSPGCGGTAVECPPGCVPLCPPGCQPVPPGTPPTVPPPVSPNTLAAIGRIQFGNAGCTATIIGPRRDDGRWDVMTAAHCVSSKGQSGTMKLRDGRQFGIQTVAIDTKADVCWCVTTVNSEVFPFAFLAPQSPPPGARIWHAGFGIDNPGNREDGSIEAGPDTNGQNRYRLSVSSGDSGGGICLDSNGHVLSPVCCTTQKGALAQVWGGSPEAAARLRPKAVSSSDWTPLEIPERMPPLKD